MTCSRKVVFVDSGKVEKVEKVEATGELRSELLSRHAVVEKVVFDSGGDGGDRVLLRGGWADALWQLFCQPAS